MRCPPVIPRKLQFKIFTTDEAKINDVFSVNKSTNVTSRARAFIRLNFSNHANTSALFDTGASCSLMSQRSFLNAKQYGLVKQSHPVGDLALTNASGKPMRVDGVFTVQFHALNKKMEGEWIVSPDLQHGAIVGMNLISKYGMILDPKAMCVRVKETDSNAIERVDMTQELDGTTLRTTQKRRVEPGVARRTKCQLTDKTGKEMKAQRDIMCEIAGIAVALRTDNEGTVNVWMPNPATETLTIEEGTILGRVEELERHESFTREEMTRISEAKATQYQAQGARREAPMKPDLIEKAIRQAPTEMKPKLRKLLNKYGRAFRKDQFDTEFIGGQGKPQAIKLKEPGPVYTQQYKLPLKEMETIKQHVFAWLKAGVIRKSDSKFNSPVFCVPKENGKLKVVLDYRKLNAHCLPDKYDIKTIEQCLEEVGNNSATIFSYIDMYAGFWQMNLGETSKKYTAFTIPGMGQFEWITAPMGIMGSPAAFGELMESMMHSLENVNTYVDECLVHTETQKGHLETLEQVLKRFIKHNVKANIEECVFAADRVQYAGHMISRAGIQPGPDNITAVMDAQVPRSVKQVKMFLALCKVFKRYIKHFAKISAPLEALTRPEVAWQGDELSPLEVEAFMKLKQIITSAPILALSRKEGEMHLYTDAAQGGEDEGGLGAVLMQTQKNGEKRVIGYASRRLMDNEPSFPAFILEMQAACYGMEYFAPYLKARTFSLYVDHKPLLPLTSADAKTLNKLQLKMQDFFFTIKYVPGKENAVADFLSRYQGMGVAAVDVSTHRISTLQEADPALGPLRQQMKTQTPLEANGEYWQMEYRKRILRLHKESDVLFVQAHNRKGHLRRGDFRVVIPKTMTTELIREAHNSRIAGHSGIFKTSERIKEHFWWPDMDADIAHHVRQCEVCQAATSKGTLAKAPLQPLPIPEGPNKRIHVDLYTDLKVKGGGRKHILVMTDAFSKLVALRAIKDKSAPTVALAILEGWIYSYGVPEMILSDQGKEFCNALQGASWANLRTQHKVTSAYHPQCNAQAEVFNKTMGHFLRTILHEAEATTIDWETYLGPLMFSHNTAVHKSTKLTPFATTFGYDPRVPLWDTGRVLEGFNSPHKIQEEDDLRRTQQQQRRSRRMVVNNSQQAKEEQARSYDKRHKAVMPDFKAGDPVWTVIRGQTFSNYKLAPKFEKATIVEKVGPVVYKIERLNRPTRSKFRTVNVADMKPRGEQEEDEEVESEDEDQEEQCEECVQMSKDEYQAIDHWTPELILDLMDQGYGFTLSGGPTKQPQGRHRGQPARARAGRPRPTFAFLKKVVTRRQKAQQNRQMEDMGEAPGNKAKYQERCKDLRQRKATKGKKSSLEKMKTKIQKVTGRVTRSTPEEPIAGPSNSGGSGTTQKGSRTLARLKSYLKNPTTPEQEQMGPETDRQRRNRMRSGQEP